MSNIRQQLCEEVSRIQSEIDDQKKLIKQHVGNMLIIETAEAEMKALHARLSVLEANLAKYGD